MRRGLKIVSGGQIGVDRAALDFALERGFEIGGWCPKGRKAEDGTIHVRYLLEETPSEEYSVRTEWNVRDSDGTLILYQKEMSGGTALTSRMAKKHKKPCLEIDLLEKNPPDIWKWIEDNDIAILNIAGPRTLYDEALGFLKSNLT